jgi:hypothetical protein
VKPKKSDEHSEANESRAGSGSAKDFEDLALEESEADLS